MTFQETWLPFIYLYGVGGLAFFLGLILIIKTKALRLDYFKLRGIKYLVHTILDVQH